MPRACHLVFAFVFALGLASHARAEAVWESYAPATFAEAQAAGRIILVDVSAEWCPTCKAQEPILDELRTDEGMQDVLFVRVDFDEHKGFLQDHRIPRQSTILVFHGETEVARSIAETDRDRLRSFVFEAVDR